MENSLRTSPRVELELTLERIRQLDEVEVFVFAEALRAWFLHRRFGILSWRTGCWLFPL